MADNFEQTFGKLVADRLKEQTPFLMEYAVGFEVKDKNEDGTVGLGVYAFLIDTVPAYIPVVYYKGRINGFELLWLSEQRLMVPAVNNWISVIKKNKKGLFGKILNKPEIHLKASQQPEAVVLDSATFPYALKTASEDGGYVGEDIVKGMLSGTPSDAKISGILTSYLENSPLALAHFCKTALEDPEFADAVQNVYPPGTLANLVKKAQEGLTRKNTQEKKTHRSQPGVRTITDISDPDVHLLSSSQKRQLVKQGSFILDTRPVHSTVFNQKQASDLLSNPRESGYCRVLDLDGSLKEAWVCRMRYKRNGLQPDQDDIGYPENTRGLTPEDSFTANPGKEHVGIVFKEKPNQVVVYPHNDIFVTDVDQIEPFEAGQKATKDSLISTIQSLSAKDNGSDTDMYVMHAGEDSSLILAGKHGLYEFSACASEVTTAGPELTLEGSPYTRKNGQRKTVSVVFVDKDNVDIRLGANAVTIGPAAKLFKTVKPKSISFRPGRPQDFNKELVKNAGLDTLEITCEGPVFYTRFNDQSSGISTEEKEFRRMVFDVGIDPGSARELVKKAKESEDGKVSYLVKRADAVSELHSDPDTLAVKETQPSVTVIEGVRDSGILLSDARNTAVAAAENGNNDLFELTSLRGLIDMVEDNSLRRDSFIKLLRGMDECGRSLFRLYWKREEMLDQYGPDDVERLEDALRTNFKRMGEMVLFLQDKFTSLHGPFENSMEGLLSEDMGGQGVDEF